jgi:hypothetical protein
MFFDFVRDGAVSLAAENLGCIHQRFDGIVDQRCANPSNSLWRSANAAR